MGNKIIVSVGLFLLGIGAAFSQEIPLQLMLVDSNGFEKVNQNVKLRLTMSNDTSLTTGQYQEVHITQSNEFGIISENLGSGVATTNSQVLSLEQFAFSSTEPLIMIELDTSNLTSQYYTLGFVPYSYPMVSRRALFADSANYSNQSMNSEFSDTAEFARNFNESYDDDTSATNEIQQLSFDAQSKVLSISNGNQIRIGNENKIQVESSIIEFGNNFNSNQWMAGDSIYLYGISSTNSNELIKALIQQPDSIVSTINMGFNIDQIYPADSIVVGFNNVGSAMGIQVCDLNGQNSASRSISRGSGSDRILAYMCSAQKNKVSVFVDRYSGSNDDLYLWDLQNSTFTSVQINRFRNSSSDFIIEEFYSSGINGQGSGYYYRFRNRWNNNLYTAGRAGSSNEYPVAVDSLGAKYIIRGGYNNAPLFNFSKYDSTSSAGYFSLYGNTPALYENGKGYYLFSSSLAKSSSNSGQQQLFLVNVNNINTTKTTLSLIIEDWLNHPEAGVNLQWVKGYNEFLILFSNVKNIWVNRAYRNDNFLLRVPYEE